MAKARGPRAVSSCPAPPHLKIPRGRGDRMLTPAARIRAPTPLPLPLPLPLAGRRTARRPDARPPAPAAREAQRPRTSTDDEAALLRALPWGAIVIDRHYDIQTLNPAARRLLGIHGPGLGEDLVHLTERLPAAGLRAAIDAVRGGAAEREILIAAETVQGEQRYLQLICRPHTRTDQAAGDRRQATEEATVEELHTTNDDLQARNLEMQALAAGREEQRQLSEAERARLAAVLLSMGDAVFVVDRTGTVALTNAAVERLLGPAGADVVPEDEGEEQPLPAEETPRARAARGESLSMTFTLPGAGGARRRF